VCCALVICFACRGIDSSDTPEDGGRYLLVSGLNGFCVDVPASSMEEGKQLILWPINNRDNPTPNQTWKLQATGNKDEYVIVSEQNSMCLTVVDASLKDNAPIVQLPNNENAANQIWIFKENGDQYSITSKLSSKLLTVPGFGTDRGSNLVQFEPIDKAKSQAFRLIRAQ
jgi:hypothetical protein